MIKFEELERIHVELSSACNAACPSCPRNADGGYTIPWLKIRTMSFEDFKTIFNSEVLLQIKDILMCGNYGDPIYCKDLPHILQYINSINPDLHVRLHTNGGIRSHEWWSSLPAAHGRLTTVFSIDGLEDTNHIYRRNVVWDRVISNAKSYIDAGGVAIWEYLIFQHNEHQLDDAKALSNDLGFDSILFKRAFGFDTVDSSYEAMRVVDNNGDVDYYIYPPTDGNHKNKDDSSEQLKRYQPDIGLPLIAYERSWKNNNDYYESCIKQEAAHYKELDGTAISCMTKNSKEVYIDSAGNLHPCCFLAIGSQNVTLAYDSLQYNKWLEKQDGVNNLKEQTLKEVMDTQFLKRIEDTWKLTHEQGRMQCCSKMCSVKFSPKERLYIDDNEH